MDKKDMMAMHPAKNASRAPGLWQHIKISFQAPRFDATGQKISNAKIIYVWLNGVLVQDNLELAGPTRGSIGNTEIAAGPLRLQGDHGAVAFRNINITSFDKPNPVLSNLKYWVYKGAATALNDSKIKALNEGTTSILSSNINTIANDFLIHYTGNLKISEAGEYNFLLSVPGGKGKFSN